MRYAETVFLTGISLLVILVVAGLFSSVLSVSEAACVTCFVVLSLLFHEVI